MSASKKVPKKIHVSQRLKLLPTKRTVTGTGNALMDNQSCTTVLTGWCMQEKTEVSRKGAIILGDRIIAMGNNKLVSIIIIVVKVSFTLKTVMF